MICQQTIYFRDLSIEHENSAQAFLNRTLDGNLELNNKVYNPSISASTKSILSFLYDEGRHECEGKVIGGSEVRSHTRLAVLSLFNITLIASSLS